MLAKGIIFITLLGVIQAKELIFERCENSADTCEVSKLDINPSCTVSKTGYCNLKKGKPWSITATFTPKFSGGKVKTGLFGVIDGNDIPFDDLREADACQHTACPLEAGKQQDFTLSLTLNKKLPSGSYTFKWLMWNEDNKSELCCYTTKVRLIR